MTEAQKRTWDRRGWFGPALMVLGLLAAAAMLEAALGDLPDAWYVRGYLVLAMVIIGVYMVTVFLPQRRLVREHSALHLRFVGQGGAVKQALEEVRFGDLVEAVNPALTVDPDMEHAVAAAARSLAGLIQQIQTSSVEVATAAGTVQETAAELASGSSQQAAAVVEITATMEELARTAGLMETNAASQAKLAGQSEAAGNAGATAVEAAVAGLEAVRERMDTVADRADTLGQRSREIYRVLDLINEIAQETHILSLNAAIEASAAGEHGERFAVVADEVRRLAERSRESVDSVRHLLDDFSEAIRAVVVATEEGSKSAAHVIDQSHAAEDSITQLRDALTDTAQRAREISLATQEQRTASDQVVLTLREVSEVIQRIADGLNRFTGSAERLNQLALSIQLLTQSFRLDSAHSLKHQVIEWSSRLADFNTNLEAVEGHLQELMDHCPYLELIYLVDTNGAMVSFVVNRDIKTVEERSGAVTIGQVYADRPWFQSVVRSGRTAVTPLYESLLSGEQCFTIAAAVYDIDGNMTGAVGVDVNARNWTRI